MMQTAIPCLLFGNTSSQLRLLGGTNAEFAPEIDYYSLVRIRISEIEMIRFENLDFSTDS